MNMSFQLPFRILVIDDFHGKSSAKFQAAVSGYLYDLVKGNEHGKDCRVDVRFANTPEIGVSLWQKEIFDLTLVDSDFKDGKKKAMRDDAEKLSFLDLDVELVGGYLFRFLNEIMDRDQEQRDGNLSMRDGCSVVLWTGMHCRNEKERERAERLLDILGPKLRDGAFVPKCEEERENWENTFNDLVKKRLDMGCDGVSTSFVGTLKDSIESVLEKRAKIGRHSALARLVTSYKTKSAMEFTRICASEWPNKSAWVWMEQERAEWKLKFSQEKPADVDCVWLSPELRTKTKLKDILVAKPDSVDIEKSWPNIIIPPTPSETESNKSNKAKVKVIAAATPLTGVSAVGKDRAIEMLKRKVGALLSRPFDRIVLKTVYLDHLNAKKKVDWPRLQIQSRQRTRCYRSAAHPRTLWNTGTTAQEAFSPEMMNEFLKECVNGSTIPAERIIVSLGSKFPDDEQRKIKTCESLENRLRVVWSKLFSTVFQDLKGKLYTDVEINVRHYLRGCINANLGGDEYLSPTTVPASGAVFGNYQAVDEEFKQWLSVVNDVALEHGKHLYLKMPFRGDLIHFIGLIMAVKKEKGKSKNAIKGLVFVNAFKSALNEPEKSAQYSPAWYGSTKSWNDQKGDAAYAPLSMRCQVSGELLQLSRNQLLFAVAKAAADAGLGLQIGGGVVDQEDLLFCSKFSQLAGAEEDLLNAVQIGTWGLMDLRLGSYMGNAGKLEAAVPCGKETRPHEGKGACTSNQPSIGENLCPRIAFCLHELCNGCGKCSRSFYCDTFLDRRGHDLPPVMDARNCTGCGLCAQICPNGAIQLFRPEDMVMLIAEGKDILFRWHRRLDACEIPHLCYMAEDIRGLVQKQDCRDSDLIQAWYDLCQAEAPHLKKSIVLYAGADESLWGGRVATGESTDVCQEMRPCPLTWEWENGVCRLLSKGDPDDWLKDIKREVAKRLNAMRR